MKKICSTHIAFLIMVLLGVFSFFTSGCSKNSSNVSPNIQQLDSLLNYKDSYLLDRLTQIEELKQKRSTAKSLEEKFLLDSLIFERFYILNADSAMQYITLCIEEAKGTGNRARVINSRINKARLLAASGLVYAALDILKCIDTQELTNDQLVEYYGQMVSIYSRLGNYTGGETNRYYITERLYKDSIMSVIRPTHANYLWYKGWDLLGSNQSLDSLNIVIEALKKELDNSHLSDRQDARNAYVLARLYRQIGDLDNYENYMALSAIIDVKIANAEIASTGDLANYIFNDGNGDINRAYNYINYSLDKALEYPNRTRAFGISKTLGKINEAYREEMLRHQHKTNVFLILLCVVAGILCLAVINIVRQNRKVKKQSKQVDAINEELNKKVTELSAADKKLNEMNQLLHSLNTDLRKKNADLYEANFVKEEYIGYVFKLYSNYISRIEDFKRQIYLKAVKKQWQEIEILTEDIDMKEELKEFYHSFDTIFLHLYPNFVSDLNTLLLPDKQIVLKEGELMNIEVRIYALIRLGITDSVKIADFLHCAPQTVYNYRLRMRSRTSLSKQEFLDKVKSLGHFLGDQGNI